MAHDSAVLLKNDVEIPIVSDRTAHCNISEVFRVTKATQCLKWSYQRITSFCFLEICDRFVINSSPNCLDCQLCHQIHKYVYLVTMDMSNDFIAFEIVIKCLFYLWSRFGTKRMYARVELVAKCTCCFRVVHADSTFSLSKSFLSGATSEIWHCG